MWLAAAALLLGVGLTTRTALTLEVVVLGTTLAVVPFVFALAVGLILVMVPLKRPLGQYVVVSSIVFVMTDLVVAPFAEQYVVVSSTVLVTTRLVPVVPAPEADAVVVDLPEPATTAAEIDAAVALLGRLAR